MFITPKWTIKISIIFLLCIFPALSQAATLGFVLPFEKVAKNDVFIAQFRVATGKDKINAIDGEISFDKDFLQVKDISTGGSVFSIWTRMPAFSNETGKIIFAGGTPNGIKEDGLVFKVVFVAQQEGLANLAVSANTNLYLNDGLGTILKPTVSNGQLAIQAGSDNPQDLSSWAQELDKDKVGPVNLTLLLGQDSSVFNGEHFLTFTATDDESGIDHFEVKEGDRGFVRAESPYLLKDQSLKSAVFVLAVDKAGNATLGKLGEVTAKPVPKSMIGWVYVILAMVLLLLVFVLFWVFTKIKNKNVSRPRKK